MTRAAALAGCDRPLATAYDVALLDLDGVLYLGADPIPTAVAAVRAARAAGMRAGFVTNNASRTPESIAERLRGLGMTATADEVVTSAQAAARLLGEQLRPGQPVLVVGAEALRREVVEAGLRAVGSADDDPAAVVQGYDPQLTYARLAEGALAVGRGALWVATNADTTMPSSRGRLPGNGALVSVIAVATGRRPQVAGKPALALHAESVRRTAARRPLVVGDRLDTDIEGALAGGSDSLLVLTGVADARDLLRAGPAERPSYLAADLSGLLRGHPSVIAEPREGGASARCRGWSADVSGDHLTLGWRPEDTDALDTVRDGSVTGEGEDPAMDGLRAACVAAWAGIDGGLSSCRVRAEAAGVRDAAARVGLPIE